ncbi:MAG: hypothetical protein ABSA77_06325, partial [Thermoguttaceae bacterium]
ELKAELISLRIDKTAPGENIARMGGHPGTSLAFWIADPENRLVAFNQKESKIESFVDDKGTDLSELMPGPFVWSRFGEFRGNRVSPGGYQVEVGGDSFPAPGATKISLKATLVFRRASNEKTIEEKDVPVKSGRKVKAGSLQLSIEAMSEEKLKENEPRNRGFRGNDLPETKMGISLAASEPLESIKSVLFFNPKGDEIKITTSGQSENSALLWKTYARDFWLAEKHDAVTVKITYYENVETLKMPLSVDTGLGF